MPLTKVVEVETERKPSPLLPPELKDEAKKSGIGSDKVSATVGSTRKAGDGPCSGACHVLGLPRPAMG